MIKFNVLTKSKKVVFTNIETNEKLVFNSFRDASLNMKISRNTINKYLVSKEIYGKYKITLTQFFYSKTPQDGSRQEKQGINIATNSFTFKECTFLCNILKDKYNLKCTVVKTVFPDP